VKIPWLLLGFSSRPHLTENPSYVSDDSYMEALSYCKPLLWEAKKISCHKIYLGKNILRCACTGKKYLSCSPGRKKNSCTVWIFPPPPPTQKSNGPPCLGRRKLKNKWRIKIGKIVILVFQPCYVKFIQLLRSFKSSVKRLKKVMDYHLLTGICWKTSKSYICLRSFWDSVFGKLCQETQG
jgi:hypothetical protein